MTNATVNTVSPKVTYRAVKTSRLYEQIVQQVEESILKGQLKPGDQLPAERDLAQSFGVSRTAVREAVNALREKGFSFDLSQVKAENVDELIAAFSDLTVDVDADGGRSKVKVFCE